MEERGTAKRLARNSMQASFARPSTGGAVTANLSAPPTTPVIAFCFARGCNLIAKTAPPGVSRIEIMELSGQASLHFQRNQIAVCRASGSVVDSHRAAFPLAGKLVCANERQ